MKSANIISASGLPSGYNTLVQFAEVIYPGFNDELVGDGFNPADSYEEDKMLHWSELAGLPVYRVPASGYAKEAGRETELAFHVGVMVGYALNGWQ